MTGVSVIDRFGAAADPALPTVAAALDPARAAAAIGPRLPECHRALELAAIRVVRHKPGRRCVIEYDFRLRDGAPLLTLIGKVRRRRVGNSAYRLQAALRDAGFDDAARDGISVPEPVARVPELCLWLQRKVEGEEATGLLASRRGPVLAATVAEAAHKVHRCGVPAPRAHGMADELRILARGLDDLAAERPKLAGRLETAMEQARRVAARIDTPAPCGIHRDFYADQVIVGAERLWLLDFDLYCLGDPALDVGNFIGHVTEQALRRHGDPAALTAVEVAVEERFLELSGAHRQAALRVYALLTLLRHVYLSHRLPGRGHCTDALLALCERRLGALERPRCLGRTAGGAA